MLIKYYSFMGKYGCHVRGRVVGLWLVYYCAPPPSPTNCHIPFFMKGWSPQTNCNYISLLRPACATITNVITFIYKDSRLNYLYKNQTLSSASLKLERSTICVCVIYVIYYGGRIWIFDPSAEGKKHYLRTCKNEDLFLEWDRNYCGGGYGYLILQLWYPAEGKNHYSALFAYV